MKLELMNSINQANFQSLHDWLKNNENYLGMRIFYSPILIEPKYLLIGINPGRDKFIEHYQDTGSKLLDLDEMDEGLHYAVYNSNTGDSIRKIFELAGKLDDLKNNTVKINCFFVATKNIEDLWSLMRDMRDWAEKTHYCSFDAFQAKNVWDIIKLIKPKYIILEGSKALENLNKFAKEVNISYMQRSNESKLAEVIYDINDEQKILAVEFKRKIYGFDKNTEADMINWVKEH